MKQLEREGFVAGGPFTAVAAGSLYKLVNL
jgi:hypothetical protein